MTIPANLQAAAPWGAEACVVCWGPEGGSYHVVDTGTPLPVNIVSGGGSGGTASSFSSAFPATGTAAGASDGTNMKPLLVDGSGNLKVTGSFTVAGTLPAGSNVIGGVTQSGTWNVGTVTTVTTVSAVTAITNALPSGTNNIGQVSLQPEASGGLSIYSVNSSGAANQDEAAVKGSAGQVYGYALFNTTASARYVKLYNLASGATSGSTPAIRIYLPPTGGANLSMENGLQFGTGICIRITTGAADSDSGACSANDVLGNVFYK
jgi:hypothetical protein